MCKLQSRVGGSYRLNVVLIHLPPWLIAKPLHNGSFKIIHQLGFSSSSVMLSCVRATWCGKWLQKGESGPKNESWPPPACPLPKSLRCSFSQAQPPFLRWAGGLSPPLSIALGLTVISTWAPSQQQCLTYITLKGVPLKCSCFLSSLARFRMVRFWASADKFWKAHVPGPLGCPV